MKHERQTLIGWWRQGLLAGASVAVVGNGATGAATALAVAHAGVRKIQLMDPDSVEDHNLENQPYGASDVGRPKVLALADRIREIDSGIEVEARIAKVQEDPDWISAAWIFSCPDNVAARYYLSALGTSSGRPVIDTGIEDFQGHVKIIVQGETACQRCWPTLPVAQARASCATNPIPTTFMTGGAVASLAAAQFVRRLHGLPGPSHFVLDLLSGLTFASTLPPNPACEFCGHPEGEEP